MRRLTFVTGNPNKLREVHEVLGHLLHVESAAIDLPELQGTPESIVLAKLAVAVERVGSASAVLVEDTCLAFDALGGLPGPYVKWFLEAVGPEGLHRMLAGFEDKGGAALCTLAFHAGGDAEPVVLQGVVRGRIVAPRGASGFGWDGVFEPDAGGGRTYAEMDPVAKNSISHRSVALKMLVAHVEKLH